MNSLYGTTRAVLLFIVHYLVANKPQVLSVAECAHCPSPYGNSQSPRLLRPAMYNAQYFNNAAGNGSSSAMPAAAAAAMAARPGSCALLDEGFSVAAGDGGGLLIGGGGGGRAFLRPLASEPHSPSGSPGRRLPPSVESLGHRMSPARSMKELEAACDSMIDAIAALENAANH